MTNGKYLEKIAREVPVIEGYERLNKVVNTSFPTFRKPKTVVKKIHSELFSIVEDIESKVDPDEKRNFIEGCYDLLRKNQGNEDLKKDIYSTIQTVNKFFDYARALTWFSRDLGYDALSITNDCYHSDIMAKLTEGLPPNGDHYKKALPLVIDNMQRKVVDFFPSPLAYLERETESIVKYAEEIVANPRLAWRK